MANINSDKITIGFTVDQWVWLCEMLSMTIHELGDDLESVVDAQTLLNTLEAAERGEYARS